jgi:hypothetical protein
MTALPRKQQWYRILCKGQSLNSFSIRCRVPWLWFQIRPHGLFSDGLTGRSGKLGRIVLLYCVQNLVLLFFSSSSLPERSDGLSCRNLISPDFSDHKNSAFLHLQERFGPDVTNFTFGTGRRDPWPRPKFVAAQGVCDAWLPNWMKLYSTELKPRSEKHKVLAHLLMATETIVIQNWWMHCYYLLVYAQIFPDF